VFSSLLLVYCPQIIQKGSYSFPLCGVIIACIGFILFIGLLLFSRMHRNYLTGTVTTSNLKLCCIWFVFIIFTLILPLHPNRNIEKVHHGGGTSNRAEWICKNRTERGAREQLRGAAAVFCPLLDTVENKVQQSIFKYVLPKTTK